MSPAQKLLAEIERLNKRYTLLERGDRIVVGVSGGPDSVALLALLTKLKRKHGLCLAAAHLNHGLRSQNARRDEALAKDTAARLGAYFYSKRVAVRTIARKTGRSLEETGRLQRYRFFEETARRFRANKIATGHTLDEQAETVLFRLFRGSGLRGLSGIPIKRAQGRFQVVRPLLASQKKDLCAFLRAEGLRYHNDETNRSPEFARNKLRHQLLPAIRKLFNPRIEENLASLAAVCADAQEYLDMVSQKAYEACRSKRSRGKLTLNAASLRGLPAAVQGNAVLRALEEQTGALKRFTHDHVLEILGLARTRRKGLELHLPGGVRVSKPTPDRLEIAFSGRSH